MKKTWKSINETFSRNKFSFKLPSTFLHNDFELKDPFEIADAFNTHFANIGMSIASEIEKLLQTMQTIRSIKILQA